MREVMRGPFGEADLVAVGRPQARRVGPPTAPADYCPDTLKKSCATPPPARNVMREVMREVMRGPFWQADLVAVGAGLRRGGWDHRPPRQIIAQIFKKSCATPPSARNVMRECMREFMPCEGASAHDFWHQTAIAHDFAHDFRADGVSAHDFLQLAAPPRMTFFVKIRPRMTSRMTFCAGGGVAHDFAHDFFQKPFLEDPSRMTSRMTSRIRWFPMISCGSYDFS